MTPPARTASAPPPRRVFRASLAWSCVLTSLACAARPPARASASFAASPVARVPEVAAPTPETAVPTATAASPRTALDAPPEAPAVASLSAAASPCVPLPLDRYGERQSPRRVYDAARRYFLVHTGPGSRHALGPDLVRERPTLRFSNTDWREPGAVLQATIDEIRTTYPDSLVFPTRRRPRLRTDACYDEVYLDLTEDGRYVVIVETATARPVFMYWQHYRP